VLLAAAWLAAGLLLPASVSAQAAGGNCQFVLGFQTLHDLDPADIGDCTDNQAFAPNGDAQQHTTKGLMAWRKADNWTAFTNGYQTWISGPAGLEARLNTQRFSWEANPDNLPLAGSGIASPSAAPSGCTQPNIPNGCPISIGTPVSAVLAQPGDQHKWVLNLPSPTSVRITLSNLAAPYALHVLSDPSAQGLLAEVTAHTTSDKSVSLDLAARTYLIYVDSPTGQTSAAAYQLSVALENGVPQTGSSASTPSGTALSAQPASSASMSSAASASARFLSRRPRSDCGSGGLVGPNPIGPCWDYSVLLSGFRPGTKVIIGHRNAPPNADPYGWLNGDSFDSSGTYTVQNLTMYNSTSVCFYDGPRDPNLREACYNSPAQ